MVFDTGIELGLVNWRRVRVRASSAQGTSTLFLGSFMYLLRRGVLEGGVHRCRLVRCARTWGQKGGMHGLASRRHLG